MIELCTVVFKGQSKTKKFYPEVREKYHDIDSNWVVCGGLREIEEKSLFAESIKTAIIWSGFI